MPHPVVAKTRFEEVKLAQKLVLYKNDVCDKE